MRVGIVIAIVRELKAFLEKHGEVTTDKVGYFEVYKTVIGGNEVVAVCSGWGKIDASAATELLVARYGCEAILNFGVTGALTSDIKVEDMFVVEKCVNYEYDVSPIDSVKRNQYAEFADEYIPLDNNLIDKAIKLMPSLKKVICATGDKFVEIRDEKVELNQRLGANICDMELASIARIAWLNGVPCLSIKCVSDELDGNGADFDKNVVRSAAVAFDFIEQFIGKCI